MKNQAKNKKHVQKIKKKNRNSEGVPARDMWWRLGAPPVEKSGSNKYLCALPYFSLVQCEYKHSGDELDITTSLCRQLIHGSIMYVTIIFGLAFPCSKILKHLDDIYGSSP